MELTEIRALQAGDPRALDRFYRAHAAQVLGWCIRLGSPGMDSEDMAHDVFAVAIRRIGSFRGEAALSTWLFAITRNVLANARRRAALRRFVGLSSADDVASTGPSVDEQVDRMKQRAIVQRALERLGAPQREVLVLMDLEGRSAPECAEMLGIPAGTVYSRLHYARKAFAVALEREGLRNEAAELREVAASPRGK